LKPPISPGRLFHLHLALKSPGPSSACRGKSPVGRAKSTAFRCSLPSAALEINAKICNFGKLKKYPPGRPASVTKIVRV
jgi:hypothetical protein